MLYPRYARRRLALYLIPVLLGMGGIAFSRQLDGLGPRMLVVLASVAVPLFAGGNLLARYKSGRYERTFLLAGVLLLLLGAGVSVSGISELPELRLQVSESVVNLSRLIGALSLSLGLFVVLFSVVRAGEDIEEVAERFWHLAEHMTEGFILSTAQGTIFLVNKQFLEMTGLKQEEVIGQNALDMAQRLNIRPMQEHLEKRKDGIASEYEVTWHVLGEDRRFWFSGTPIYDPQGRHTANLATVRDITEFHRLSVRVERYAESLKELVEEQSRRLVRSEERFRQLILSMNEGFLTLDTDNKILFVNDRLSQMLTGGQDVLPGRDFFDFVEPDSRVRLLNLLARSASGDPAEHRQEVVLKTTEEELLPVLMGVSYVRDVEEGTGIYSLVVTNVADLKIMQEELQQRARELEQANEELLLHDRAKDSFLSNVSHELRTPISTVQGYVEMLEGETLGETTPAQRNAFKVMNRNIERLLGLINEMIDFSRMEIRGVTLNMNLFDPVRLLKDASASAFPQASVKTIHIREELDNAPPFAWGDRERLGQVLGILLNNAIKFTNPGGDIVLRAEEGDDGALKISVADTGIGIDPIYQDRVFDKFFQVDSSKSRRYEGTGIGLSIAESIVQAHQGHIGLQSTPGEGTTFTVTLPKAVFQPAASVDPRLAGATFVLVDDSNLWSTAITLLLEASGARCLMASGAAHALRQVDELTPDAFIVNDGVADIAGEVTLSLLRRDQRTELIPVLVCTAEPPQRLDDLTRQWEGVDVIRKPFDPAAFVRDVADLCERDGAQRHAQRPPDDRPRILFIDADPGVLEWAEVAMARRGVVCCCASSMATARQWVEKEPPDVIFLDADVIGATWHEAVEQLQCAMGREEPPIYLVTGAPGEPVASNRAAGVLRKPFGIAALVSALSKHRRGAESEDKP